MGIIDAFKLWIMAIRAEPSLPHMRLGGKPVEEGQNALMVYTFFSFPDSF